MTVFGCFSPQLALPSDREIRALCILDAPPPTVFAAWTDPAHLGRWRASGRFELVQCKAELRPGGIWRHVLRDTAGDEYACGGEYRRVEPGKRLEYTERLDGVPAATRVTVTFEPEGSGSRLTAVYEYATAADRDRHLMLGAKAATAHTLSALQEYVRDLREHAA